MNRSTALLLIAIALVCYGVYIASYLPAMLTGRPAPLLLLIGFVLQVVFALAAAMGVWRGLSWATGAIVLLGASVAATWLVEGFVLGIIAYGRALVAAVLAIIVAWLLVVYISRQHGPRIA